MKLKQILKRIFFNATGLTVYKRLPFGVDSFEDVQSIYKGYPFHVFFDVGANIGQTARAIRKRFATAAIYSFEPVSKTFSKLKANTAKQDVRCYQLAFGSENMEMEIYVDRDNQGSDMNSLRNRNGASQENQVKETIKIQRLDDFCKLNSIDHIDYLKIDTEGYDLEVLKGAIAYLVNQSISFIEVEVGMNPENKYHVEFGAVKEFLERHDYRIFGIYEQVQEWRTKKRILRRTNVLFVSKKTYMPKA